MNKVKRMATLICAVAVAAGMPAIEPTARAAPLPLLPAAIAADSSQPGVIRTGAKWTAKRADARRAGRLGSRSSGRRALPPGVASWLILRRKCLDKLFPSTKTGPCAKINH